MPKDIDEIRKKIGVSELDEQQRKKLFKEFIDHGGKVIESKRAKATISRQAQAVSVKPKEKEPKLERKAGPADQRDRAIITPLKGIEKKPKKGKLIDILRINIKGQILKVWNFGGKRLSDKFLNSVDREINDFFININIITGSMLKGDSSIKGEILRSSIGENNLFYECITRLNNLYDESCFAEFQKAISARRIQKSSQIEPVKNLFKRMYVLGQYIDTCKLYAQRAVKIQEKYKKIKPEIVPKVQIGLRREIDSILGDFLYKLHIILCKMEQRFLPLYSQQLDDFLEISEKDKMGYITRLEKRRRIEQLRRGREMLKKTTEIKAGVEKEKIKIPKHVERGMPIVNEALERFDIEHSGSENLYSIIESRDKMYRTLILLDTFDSQYSFVLTTGKIAYNIEYVEQKKVDIKEDLSHAYFLFNEAREEANGYMDIIKEIRKIENERRLTQYQKSIQMEKFEKKRQILNKQSRNRIAEVMKRIEDILSTVITDYRGEKILLQNPDEYLSFDVSIDGQKKLNGRKVIGAIIETFLFAATFAFMLNYGELSGPGIFIETDDETQQ